MLKTFLPDSVSITGWIYKEKICFSHTIIRHYLRYSLINNYYYGYHFAATSDRNTGI